MPRPPSHNLGQRATWAAMAGYNLSRAPSTKTQHIPQSNGHFNPTQHGQHNIQPGAYKWSAGGIGNQQAYNSTDTINPTDEEALIKIAFFYRLRQLQEQQTPWQPLPIQIQLKPDEDTSWDTWMLRGGRGSGKTEGASRYVLKHLRKYGPKARVGVGGKTAADARDTCAEGESGLITLAPNEFYYHRSLGEARHIKGGYVKFMGAEQPARWNGPQWSLLWCVEGNTLVATECGEIPIKNIRPGTLVHTRDGLRKVTAALLTRRNAETLLIRFSNGKSLQATPDHPIWVQSKGWVRVDQLQIGDELESPVNVQDFALQNVHQPIIVVSVEKASSVDVYDLTVEDSHEFYANGILIHNCDEAGLWPRETFDQAQFGLRLGEYPRTIISTTPKFAKWLYELEQEPTTVHTTGTLYDNVYLSEFARNRLIRMYKGTSLEKRELEGEWSFQSENALWNDQLFHYINDLPQLIRIAVAIDPAVTSGENADDTGIVAAGIDSYDLSIANGYVLRDRTVHLSPFGWGETAIALYDELEADMIVAEVNNGGDLVEANIRAVCNALKRPMVPFKKIHATRGKIVRAQPIVALYEQSRVYHYRGSTQTLIDETLTEDGLYVPTEYSNINLLTELENEMCSWDPESYKSPNRMDAAVWVLTELLLKPPEPRARRLTYTPRVSISRY